MTGWSALLWLWFWNFKDVPNRKCVDWMKESMLRCVKLVSFRSSVLTMGKNVFIVLLQDLSIFGCRDRAPLWPLDSEVPNEKIFLAKWVNKIIFKPSVKLDLRLQYLIVAKSSPFLTNFPPPSLFGLESVAFKNFTLWFQFDVICAYSLFDYIMSCHLVASSKMFLSSRIPLLAWIFHINN